MWQSVSYILFYGEFSAILVFLFLIWRENVTRTQKAQQALIDVAMMNSDAAMKASDAAQKAVETLHAVIVKEKPGV